jgi:hypothetical protein
MTEDVTLNEREQQRLMVLNRVLSGQMKQAEAAEVLDLSVRRVRWILAAYREDCAAARIHGNRGRHWRQNGTSSSGRLPGPLRRMTPGRSSDGSIPYLKLNWTCH